MSQILVLEFELENWDNVPQLTKDALTLEVNNLITDGYYPFFIVKNKTGLEELFHGESEEILSGKTVICFRQIGNLRAQA